MDSFLSAGNSVWTVSFRQNFRNDTRKMVFGEGHDGVEGNGSIAGCAVPRCARGHAGIGESARIPCPVHPSTRRTWGTAGRRPPRHIVPGLLEKGN